MKHIILSMIAVAALTGFMLDAQEMQRNRRSGRRSAMNPGAWEKVQSELKTKDKAAYDKVVKLAETNLFAAMTELRNAAKKNNISMPGGRGFGGPRGEGGMPPPMGGPGGMPPPMMDSPHVDRGNEARQAALDSIKAKDPAGYAAYEAELKKAEAAQKQVVSISINAEKKLALLSTKTRSDVPETMQSYMLKVTYLQGKYGRVDEPDPEVRKQKLKELAAKEGLKLGDIPFRFGRNRRRMGNSEDESKTSVSRSDPMSVMRKLRRRYPEEMRKIDELRRSDPSAANEEFKKLMKKAEMAR